MSRRGWRTRLVVVLVLTIAASACGGGSSSDDTLPSVVLDSLEGSAGVAIAEVDEPRVYNLWATWCAPCRAELPAFDAVAAESDIAIVGINIGESGGDAAELVDELGLSFPQLLDPDAAVQRALRITGMPATIFAGAEGEVLRVHNGELSRSELEELLSEVYASG